MLILRSCVVGMVAVLLEDVRDRICGVSVSVRPDETKVDASIAQSHLLFRAQKLSFRVLSGPGAKPSTVETRAIPTRRPKATRLEGR
jgi:hypothetical protein